MFNIMVSDVKFESMLTLTYGKGFPLSGRIVKRHLNRFLTGYRRSFFGEYVWFLEFQRRGAPHFHMFSQVSRPSPGHRMKAASLWCSAIGLRKVTDGAYTDLKSMKVEFLSRQVYAVNKRARHWEAFRSPDGAIRYAAKYCTKPYQKVVPESYQDVGRFWGTSRGLGKIQPTGALWNASEDEVRGALRSMGYSCSDWEYLPKYAFGRVGSEGE